MAENLCGPSCSPLLSTTCDVTQVDEQDFKFLTALISALKASSISSLNLTNCGLTSEVAGTHHITPVMITLGSQS